MKGSVRLAQLGLISSQKIVDLERKANGLVEFPLQDAFPWSLCCFGFRIYDATHVRIYGGEIQIADRVPVTVGNTALEITVDYSKVGYEYTYASGTLVIKNFGASMAYDAAHYRKWLYQFRLVNSLVSLFRLNFMGPSLPSNFGDTPS